MHLVGTKETEEGHFGAQQVLAMAKKLEGESGKTLCQSISNVLLGGNFVEDNHFVAGQFPNLVTGDVNVLGQRKIHRAQEAKCLSSGINESTVLLWYYPLVLDLRSQYQGVPQIFRRNTYSYSTTRSCLT